MSCQPKRIYTISPAISRAKQVTGHAARYPYRGNLCWEVRSTRWIPTDSVRELGENQAIRCRISQTDCFDSVTRRRAILRCTAYTVRILKVQLSWFRSMPKSFDYEFDVFLCHASEDKEGLARPLTQCLEQQGLRVWYDESQLTLGDSIRRSIDRGLSKSRFGVVILSHAFFSKEWPQKELDALISREDGRESLLIPVWHEITREDVGRYSPLLADRLAATSDSGVVAVGKQILELLQKNGSQSEEKPDVGQLRVLYLHDCPKSENMDYINAPWLADELRRRGHQCLEGWVVRDPDNTPPVEESLRTCILSAEAISDWSPDVLVVERRLFRGDPCIPLELLDDLERRGCVVLIEVPRSTYLSKGYCRKLCLRQG